MTYSNSENNQKSQVLAGQLKAQMQRSGVTASDLSAQTGIAMATLSRILSGKVSPSFANIAKLATCLNLSLDALTNSAGVTTVESSSAQAGETSAPTAQTVAGEDYILARYELSDTDHAPKAAGQLLETALCGRWVPSWTEQLVNPEQPTAKAVRARQVGTRRMEVEMVIPNSWVEYGSIPGLLSVLGAALTGTGAKLQDVALPNSLIGPFEGPGFGVNGVREMASKFGRPLLATTIRPMQGLSPRVYGRAVHEALRGGVDMTCDPTLLHSTPTNPWKQRYRMVVEAVHSAMRDTNEYKFHAFNITAGTLDEMIERAEYVKEFSPLHVNAVLVDSAAIGWMALQNLATWCRKNDMVLCAMGGRTLAGGLLPEPLTAKLLRLVGADVVSTASPLRGGNGGRREVMGVINQLTDSIATKNEDNRIYYKQNFLNRAPSLPACGGGHNPWHFPRLIDALGNDIIIQCGGCVMGHPWGSAAGATAARVAVEAVVKAQAESTNIAVDSREILQNAQRQCPELRVALDHWQEGAFLFGVVLGGDAVTGAKVTTFPTNHGEDE